jgi:hypothetical protein
VRRLVSWRIDQTRHATSLWVVVAAGVVFIGVIPTLWAKRGPWFGAVAALTYGAAVLVAFAGRMDPLRWARQHPVLDSAAVVPAGYVALGCITTWTPGACLALSLGVGVPLMADSARRRRLLAAAPSTD